MRETERRGGRRISERDREKGKMTEKEREKVCVRENQSSHLCWFLSKVQK